MSRIISRAESFERVYEVFQQINFSAFDFLTVKESMIEYIKTYFPEDFNDYIESSEFIAILELFAYMAELVSYRLDIVAHENFITQAQRKESVLRLAKLISYKASRNVPSRGFVKINSIRTTENIPDTDGNNLANQQIRWNDPNNPNWKNQFILIMNRILEQPFGSVAPADRIQVEDIIFEHYQLENVPTQKVVVPYSITVSGQGVPMELVPTELDENLGPVERHPERNRPFSFTFANDGLGDGSNTTGFLMFTRQGTMNIETTVFDGVTPNQTFDVGNVGINNTDVFLNNIDADTGDLLNAEGRWEEVDTVQAQNIVFNTVNNRNKFEVETLDNDGVRLIFGDGQFANIPNGTFDIWHRVSLVEPVVIPQNSVASVPVTFNYLDISGNVQSMTFTYSLINNLVNAAASETIDHIRRTAPSTYFAQDRMVSGEDYNTFPLQDTAIAKLRAVNRTFAGDSKFIPWHDPSETYENVKIFGNDLIVYYDDGVSTQSLTSAVTTQQLLDTVIEPILSTSDFTTAVVNSSGGLIQPEDVRRRFFTSADAPEPDETSNILAALDAAVLAAPATVFLYYGLGSDEWQVTTDPISDNIPNFDPGAEAILWEPQNLSTFQGTWSIVTPYAVGDIVDHGIPGPFSYYIATVANTGLSPDTNPGSWSRYEPEGMIEATIGADGLWSVTRRTTRIIAESPTTQFWNTNDGNQVVTFDSLTTQLDDLVILNANINPEQNPGPAGAGILPANLNLNILQQANDPDTGLPSINRLVVTPEDTNEDGVPDFDVDVDGDGTPDFNWNEIIADDRASAVDFPLNFSWFHYTPRLNLVDPAASNLIDMFILTQGYVSAIADWVAGNTNIEPTAPTPLELRNSFGDILDKKMISDTVILRTGLIRLLFGDKAEPELQGQLKVIKSPTSTLTDNRIKTEIVDVVNEFFDIDLWEFGETFYFTELAGAIHQRLPADISSVVVVPTFSDNQFGNLFQVEVREDEVVQPDVTVDDIIIVQTFTDDNLRLEPGT